MNRQNWQGLTGLYVCVWLLIANGAFLAADPPPKPELAQQLQQKKQQQKPKQRKQEAPSAETTAAGTQASSQIRTPAESLGRPTGTDYHLADWQQVSSYYKELAQASPRMLLHNAGETTEGREFLYAIISSEENLAQLDKIKQQAALIADPRRAQSSEELTAAIETGRVILFITPSMHSNEPASTEMGMQLAWQLATEENGPWPLIRERVVVVLLPSLNPDGVDHVSKWYHETKGTHEEGAALLKLYQFYTGHDNNRDWFGLTQQETRLLTKMLYQEWYPQVLWDVHQQGSVRDRFFVPPYRDPLNPNLDPGIVAGVNALGSRALLDMTRAGLTGIATGTSYDNWWNGGNRSVPTRHNILGILTEAASANLATPLFLSSSDLRDPLNRKTYSPSNKFLVPWPGGWWRLGDIQRYQLTFAESLLSSLAREPDYWLRNTAEAAQRTIDTGTHGSPKGWIIPTPQRDLAALARLVDILHSTGVELHTLNQPAEIDLRTHPSGTLIIRRDQPYGNFAKDLLELKTFPEGETPYDVTGWALAPLFGIRVAEYRQSLGAETDMTRIQPTDNALAAYPEDSRQNQSSRTLSLRNAEHWKRLVGRLKDEIPQAIRIKGTENQVGLAIDSKRLSGENSSDWAVVEKLPRIGVYAPWRASMDEGWLRWVLDHYEIPFQQVRNETLRAGQLHQLFDVLILPNIPGSVLSRGRTAHDPELPYLGGLLPEGLNALEEFTRNGGRLIACGSASQWLIQQWNLPLQDVTTAKDFLCTGSVLRAVPNSQNSEYMFDLPDEMGVMFARSQAWQLPERDKKPANPSAFGDFTGLLTFPSHNVLLAGHIEKPETLAGAHAWVTAPVGKGRLHLLGISPHYRGWSQGTFHLLFRAILMP